MGVAWFGGEETSPLGLYQNPLQTCSQNTLFVGSCFLFLLALGCNMF